MIVLTHVAIKLAEGVTEDEDLGDLVDKIAESLSPRDARINKRLAGIEGQLEELLGQPYLLAMRTGARALKGAEWASTEEYRAEELDSARRKFREAAAAGRSALLRGVAEYCSLWCSAKLKRTDLAGVALRELNRSAVEAMFEAGELASSEFSDEAVERARLLLHEAAVIAPESLDPAVPPEFEKLPGPNGVSRWLVRPNAKGSTRIGSLTVVWRNVDVASATTVERAPEMRSTYNPLIDGAVNWVSIINADRPYHTVQTDTVSVDVMVRSDPALSQPASLQLELPGHEVAEKPLAAGEGERRVPRTLRVSKVGSHPGPICRLVVGGVLVFEPGASTIA